MMKILETISSAIASVFSNKTRTFLTMIGIIIGVASVIVITSLGNGFKETINKNFETLNAKAIQIMGSIDGSGIVLKEDADLLRNHPEVKYISGYFQGSAILDLKNPNETDISILIGSDVDFTQMQKNFFDLLYGRVFTEKENLTNAQVCILDENMAYEVFGRRDAVGSTANLYINGKDYEFLVIGVTKVTDANFMASKQIQVPLNTVLDIYNTDEVTMLYLEIYDTDKMTAVKRELTRILAATHNKKDSDYMAMANMEQIEMIMEVIDIFTMFISFVATISLLVGGIGVMNIMLVTVTERTKEIGIRKSLGATDVAIKAQFLIEAVVICSLGGIIGIVFGYASSHATSYVLRIVVASVTGMPTEPPVLSMPIAIGAMMVSTIIGVVFGVYPAGKAAKLDPIDCLRYE